MTDRMIDVQESGAVRVQAVEKHGIVEAGPRQPRKLVDEITNLRVIYDGIERVHLKQFNKRRWEFRIPHGNDRIESPSPESMSKSNRCPKVIPIAVADTPSHANGAVRDSQARRTHDRIIEQIRAKPGTIVELTGG